MRDKDDRRGPGAFILSNVTFIIFFSSLSRFHGPEGIFKTESENIRGDSHEEEEGGGEK